MKDLQVVQQRRKRQYLRYQQALPGIVGAACRHAPQMPTVGREAKCSEPGSGYEEADGWLFLYAKQNAVVRLAFVAHDLSRAEPVRPDLISCLHDQLERVSGRLSRGAFEERERRFAVHIEPA